METKQIEWSLTRGRNSANFDPSCESKRRFSPGRPQTSSVKSGLDYRSGARFNRAVRHSAPSDPVVWQRMDTLSSSICEPETNTASDMLCVSLCVCVCVCVHGATKCMHVSFSVSPFSFLLFHKAYAKSSGYTQACFQIIPRKSELMHPSQSD